MARRIAEERGWTIGREVGWHVRFERRFTADTRLLVVTEGILTARLQQDPLLSRRRHVVFDEFHERSLHADLGLALARQAWLARSDLRIVVMSATLDIRAGSRVSRRLPDHRGARSPHPLAIEYAPGESVATAIGRVLPRTRGHVLCFLPGRAEIEPRSASAARARRMTWRSFRFTAGSTPPRRTALRHRPSMRRRVILATNIAETSLTVQRRVGRDRLGLVKGGALRRRRGVDRLTLERVTLDSADQRAGRAARLGPGLVRRLWDARDRLRPHREPEIPRVDLSPPVLSILAAGGRLHDFEWFERPSPDRISAALELLTQLGAVETGRITHVGEKMQRVALPPRIARIFLEGFGAVEVCRACAWLAEPTRLTARRRRRRPTC